MGASRDYRLTNESERARPMPPRLRDSNAYVIHGVTGTHLAPRRPRPATAYPPLSSPVARGEDSAVVLVRLLPETALYEVTRSEKEAAHFVGSSVMVSKQDDEPFLREMAIVGQNLANPRLPHSLHRDAVRQAVSLVGPGFAEGQALQKRLVGLGANRNVRVAQGAFDKVGRHLPHGGTVPTEMGEELGKNLVGRDDLCPLQRLADGLHRRVPLVFVIEEGDPVICIGENPSHRVAGRFCVP